ncbi:MAG: hypothetical protein AT709_04100 [Caldivirga sp. MG_3]|nr:MAG: hypothetical protein AT709_04100 [Caldivirga sp. MG_3]
MGVTYRWVKPVVKGARGPLSHMSIVGKVMVAASLAPYLASYWFMNLGELVMVTLIGLALSLAYLASIGDLTSRLRSLSLVWVLSETTGLLVMLLSGINLTTALVKATILSTLVLIFMSGVVASLALLRLSELRYVMRLMGLGALGDSIVLALRYLLNASMALDEALTVLRSLGRVKPRPLVNSLVVSGVGYSINLAQYIEYYGIPDAKPRLRLNRLDALPLVPLLIYVVILLAATHP